MTPEEMHAALDSVVAGAEEAYPDQEGRLDQLRSHVLTAHDAVGYMEAAAENAAAEGGN